MSVEQQKQVVDHMRAAQRHGLEMRLKALEAKVEGSILQAGGGVQQVAAGAGGASGAPPQPKSPAKQAPRSPLASPGKAAAAEAASSGA